MNRDSLQERVNQRTATLFVERQNSNFIRTDRMFAALLLVQWLAAIAAAIWISPKTWAGPLSQIHPHVYAAIFLGGLVTIFPALLALLKTGDTFTRHAVAVGQMLMGALLI